MHMNPPRESPMIRLRRVAIWTGVAIIAVTLGVWQWRRVADKLRPRPNPARIRYAFPELGINIDNYPKVDGSTSTQPLQMILACKLFGVSHAWVHDETDDSRKLWPVLDDAFHEKS